MNPKQIQHYSQFDGVTFLPLGGIEDVTKNLYLYEYKDEILIVDCGIGFADETMLGVDLLLPDITYLLQTKKKIVGMVLSHGHEDHIGALPFVLPQLPNLPIFATPLTAALANEKLIEFNIQQKVQTVNFDGGEVRLGQFGITFIQVTHSVPDTANMFIRTPIGNFFHASDFKIDLTPADGKKTDYAKIVTLSQQGVLALMSDCLGSERKGFTPSEIYLEERFERVMREATGKVIITTYSSNISRINQAIAAAERTGRKVCFVGRSLIKTKTVAQRMGLIHIKEGTEITLEGLRKNSEKQIVLLVAGSQGQENSALTRIAEGVHKDVKVNPSDLVIFSSDPIPGNEVSVSSVVDAFAKRGARILYTDITRDFHVSGHGSAGDLMLMMSLTKPKHLVPISGTYKQMSAYKELAGRLGHKSSDVFLIENGQELLFTKNGVKLGKKIEIKNIFVDQISGEEVESVVVRDREKLAKEGIVIVMAEVSTATGQIIGTPDVITRGYSAKESENIARVVKKEIKRSIGQQKGHVKNWAYLRKFITDISGRSIFNRLHRRPLVLPIIIEV